MGLKRGGGKQRKVLGRSREGQAQFPVADRLTEMPRDYAEALISLKQRIQRERLRVVLSANAAMVLLYWDIGQFILGRQQKSEWGAKVIDRLAADLRKTFPDMKGFSPRNLKYMRAFATAWPDHSIVQEALAQITWYHNLTLIEKISDASARLWYAKQTIKQGWSRNILALQIENSANERQGKALTNFKTALPPPDSDMAQQVFKDPYLFDFLGTADLRREQEIEKALVGHIQRFLLELGSGFAFVGRQVHLEVGNHDFYLDLLFYHLKLRCYVVIELKAVPFEPEFVGKLNLYLSAVDDLLRQADDKPTIGLLLCKSKEKLVVEYALRDLRKPIGVSEYKLTHSLPKNLKSSLPTIADLEKELSKEFVKPKIK